MSVARPQFDAGFDPLAQARPKYKAVPPPPKHEPRIRNLLQEEIAEEVREAYIGDDNDDTHAEQTETSTEHRSCDNFPWWERLGAGTSDPEAAASFHVRTRLPGNRVGLLVDPGAHMATWLVSTPPIDFKNRRLQLVTQRAEL